jgi:hypothetical protein
MAAGTVRDDELDMDTWDYKDTSGLDQSDNGWDGGPLCTIQD